MKQLHIGAPANTTPQSRWDWTFRSMKKIEEASYTSAEVSISDNVPLLIDQGGDTQPKRFYVRPSDGNDLNDGESYSANGAWATLERAWEVTSRIACDGGSWIEVVLEPTSSAGVYTVTKALRHSSMVGATTGSPFIRYVPYGYTTDYGYYAPTVEVTGNQHATFMFTGGGYMELFGLKISNTYSGGGGACVRSEQGAYVAMVGCELGDSTSSGGALMMARYGGYLDHYTKILISGDAAYCSYADNSIIYHYAEMEYVGTPAFSSANAHASVFAYIGHDGTQTGSATGKRYEATKGSIIDTNGGGANFISGDSAGSVDAYGSYYI